MQIHAYVVGWGMGGCGGGRGWGRAGWGGVQLSSLAT